MVLTLKEHTSLLQRGSIMDDNLLTVLPELEQAVVAATGSR